MNISKIIFAILGIAILGGILFIRDQNSAKQAKWKERQEEMRAEVKQKTPSIEPPREYLISSNSLLVLRIPIDNDGFLEYQRCYVWRDHEFKSATMHCDQSPEMDFSD
jgi:hypothetical protein